VLALPWVGYQKFYDPPGNRLLKWHLGGQVEKDSRGLFETIRDGYAAQTWQEIRDTKLRNFAAVFAGDWTRLADVSAAHAEQRRSDEFFFTGRSLGWWSLGFLALPLIFLRRATRELIRPVLRLHGAFVAWIAASLVVWCLLMFGRDPAVLILGSYATILGAFVLLSAWCEFVARRAMVIFAAVQVASFATTWTVANSAIDGPLSKPALGVALAAIAAIVALLATTAAKDPLEQPQPKHRGTFAAQR
jgi:small-conductance mechanosensitive channel